MYGVVILSGTAYAHEKLDLTDDAAKGPTASNLLNNGLSVKTMLLTVEGNTCNWTEHGTAPTATSGTNIGHQIIAGASKIVSGTENIKNFSIINAVAGSDGIPKLTYYT